MTGKKKKIFITAGVATILVLAGMIYYVFSELGHLYPAPESIEKYGYYPYYDTTDNQFVSPEELRSYPERTTGGDIGFARFFKRSPYAPQKEIPKVRLKREDFPATPSSYAIYWLGHSSAILEIDGLRLMIDPVLENAAPFPGIVTRYTSSPISHNELPEIDIVLITHDHYDHLEAKTIRFLKNRECRFIVPLGVGARLKGWGIAEDKITEIAWEETLTISGLQLTACPTVHYSGRSGKDRNKTLWAAYVIKGKEKNIFWSGDTGYGEHFKKIGQQHGPFDLACVEIDGWNNGWPNTHLFPEEVIRVCQDVQTGTLLPVHWGVFDLALHPWNESIQKVYDLSQESRIELLTPLMGEKIIPGQSLTERWW